jgi:hypothetical protein
MYYKEFFIGVLNWGLCFYGTMIKCCPAICRLAIFSRGDLLPGDLSPLQVSPGNLSPRSECCHVPNVALGL